MAYKYEYAVVQETDLHRMQEKVNRLAADGYLVNQAYGIPDHRQHSHVVWMVKSSVVADGALRPLAAGSGLG